MTAEETLKKIKENLTGNFDEDMKYLEMQGNRFIEEKSDISEDVLLGISKLIYDILPEEQKRTIGSKLYIDGERFDDVYQKARQLVIAKKPEESVKLTQKLYDKIKAAYRETETERYMCFRNPFENQLYLYIYATPKKKLVKAPFDLSKYIYLHAYNLIDLGKIDEAIEALNDSIRYNPVNPDPYFELAECFKLKHDDKKILSVAKDLSLIAATPYALSRCYVDMGYYCVDIKDYESAICFYYESLIYADHPGVQGELQNIRALTGKKIAPPSRKEVVAAFEKYGIIDGASEAVVSIAAALAKDAIEKGKKDEARFYLLTLWGVTRDKDVENMLEKNYGGIPEEMKKGSFVNLKESPKIK